MLEKQGRKMAQRYVIKAPVLVAARGSDKAVVTLPIASVIETTESVDDAEVLIEVTYQGECVLMFAEDIRLRGKPVYTPADTRKQRVFRS